MARSIWNGTIAFGLMTVPVKLHTATESKTVSFREVHLDDGARIEHRRFCRRRTRRSPTSRSSRATRSTTTPTSSSTRTRSRRRPATARTASTSSTSSTSREIDPIFFDQTYYLGAGKDGAGPYRLLRDALERTGRAGIGRFTFHDREYLTAVRARDGVLVLHTLRFADEIVPGGDIDVAEARPRPRRARGEDGGAARRHAAHDVPARATTRTSTARRCSR